ncbi:WG repeat-containing protein [Spirosoma sp.]|uniref:WG repeat-containing protein n=1 Tax=Spirosoma sp. TaxID=1899569 RepID=UPI003B3A18D5
MLPTLGEYVASIEQAEHTLGHLNHLRPVRKADGQLYFSSGNFAVVFKMLDTQTGRHMALKCFLRDVPERKRRLRLVADYLKRYDTPYLLPLTYYENEVWVDSGLTEQKEFDAMLMPWVEGQTLGQYVKTRCDHADRPGLRQLTDRFDTLARWLLDQPIAHGDLKPDNIMVWPDGQLVLVDYDGFFVPDLAGERATETGTPPYTHPRRINISFDRHIDDFSLLVLGLELHTLADFPNWQAIYNPGESLLICSEDIRAPRRSALLTAIYEESNDSQREWLALVEKVAAKQTAETLQLPERTLLAVPTLIPYRKGDKWGFCDENKNIVIPCHYNEAGVFREGLARVQQGGQWGFINLTGDLVIPCQYNGAKSFSEGMALVEHQRGWDWYECGFINPAGELVIPYRYEIGMPFSEGLALVAWCMNCGFINPAGKLVIHCHYDGAESFREGLAPVKEGGKWGFINPADELVIPYRFDSARSFGEGLASVNQTEKWGFINHAGELVIPYRYDDAESFSEGLASVRQGEQWGYIDKNGFEYWED